MKRHCQSKIQALIKWKLINSLRKRYLPDQDEQYSVLDLNIHDNTKDSSK